MNHEKIFVKENGDRVKVTVSFHVWAYNTPTYNVTGHLCLKGKRTWMEVVNHDSMDYRKRTMEERRKYENQILLEHLTAEQIYEAKKELWQLLKP